MSVSDLATPGPFSLHFTPQSFRSFFLCSLDLSLNVHILGFPFVSSPPQTLYVPRSLRSYPLQPPSPLLAYSFTLLILLLFLLFSVFLFFLFFFVFLLASSLSYLPEFFRVMEVSRGYISATLPSILSNYLSSFSSFILSNHDPCA